MCGIAVCLSPDQTAKTSFGDRALKSLNHRGPDGNGRWFDDDVILIHTRLAIQDLTEAGHQPMLSRSGRYIITFNGEIYNHLDLRKRFLADHIFTGHSDTETILALFEKLGARMLQHLLGMWAMAIWDTIEKKLFVSRDRYGQKPLYYVRVKDALFFSSEITPLLHQGADRNPNLLALSEYLALGNYGHLFDQSFYSSIIQLLPGHYSVFDADGRQLLSEAYWNLEEVSYKDRLPFDDVRCREFRDLLISAVESQLLSDVPVGATLSGGLDSSIIVSSIAALGLKNFPVFTAQFPGSVNDETRYVKTVQKKWGNALDVIYTPVHEMSLKDDLKEAIDQQEEPFGDPSIIAHGFLVEAAKNAGMKVLLGGQGGDEISMGYPWMYERAFAYALHAGDYSSFYKFLNRNGAKISTIGRLILAGALPGVEHMLRMRSRYRAKSFLQPDLRLPSPNASFGRVNRFTDVYLESVKTVGIPHLCQYDDRSTMAKSIEGRMPFLDHRLLEFVSRLRPDSFYEKGLSKIIFRKAFKDLLPPEVLTRKDKVSFFTPLVKLISRDKEWALTLLNDERTLKWISELKQRELNTILSRGNLTESAAIMIFRTASLVIWEAKD